MSDSHSSMAASTGARLEGPVPGSPFLMIGDLDLPMGARVLDLGCGEGQRGAIELARRFRFAVLGIDPVSRNIEAAFSASVANGCGASGAAWQASQSPSVIGSCADAVRSFSLSDVCGEWQLEHSAFSTG